MVRLGGVDEWGFECQWIWETGPGNNWAFWDMMLMRGDLLIIGSGKPAPCPETMVAYLKKCQSART